MITKAQRGTKWSQSLIHQGAQKVTKFTKGTKHYTVPQSYTEPYLTIPFPNHTLYFRENPRPLVTASSAITIVVHSAEVSTLYPRVVISSLAERLENLLFAILYTSFGVWAKDHYMLLQRSTTWVCHALLRFPEQTAPLAVLRFPTQMSPLAPRSSGRSQSMSQSMITKYGAIPTQPSTTHNP
jgi:hypothetical protein